MISSRNIIFIFFLLTFLVTKITVYGKLTKCEKNILTAFEFTGGFPGHIREDIPRIAFLRKTINDFEESDARKYFEHLHDFLHHKDSMLLPKDYCDVQTNSLRLHADNSKEYEYTNCVTLLLSTFLNSQDKTEIIKNTFWSFTENMFSELNPDDYIYRYYYYLSGKMIYNTIADQKFPMTMKEFCATLYPKKYSYLKSRNESTKSLAYELCTTQIHNDFEITGLRQQSRSRHIIPRKSFLNYVEDDLESPNSKDYFYHINRVIKAKDGTENPREYCNTITEEEIDEEKKCIGILLSMYLDTDATTVLKDAFQNFKESDFAKLKLVDYRVRYFYYLSSSFEFYKIKKFRDTPLTPKEFCKMDRNEALNPRILMEEESVSEEVTSPLSSQQT